MAIDQSEQVLQNGYGKSDKKVALPAKGLNLFMVCEVDNIRLVGTMGIAILNSQTCTAAPGLASLAWSI